MRYQAHGPEDESVRQRLRELAALRKRFGYRRLWTLSRREGMVANHKRVYGPGKPVQNAFIESFNGTFRDDCLNLHWFPSLERAQVVIEGWRQDYNHVRPHSSLGERTPAEVLAAFTPGQETALQPEVVQL